MENECGSGSIALEFSLHPLAHLDIAPGHDGVVHQGDPLEGLAEHADPLHQRALEGEQVDAGPVVGHRVSLALQAGVGQGLQIT